MRLKNCFHKSSSWYINPFSLPQYIVLKPKGLLAEHINGVSQPSKSALHAVPRCSQCLSLVPRWKILLAFKIIISLKPSCQEENSPKWNAADQWVGKPAMETVCYSPSPLWKYPTLEMLEWERDIRIRTLRSICKTSYPAQDLRTSFTTRCKCRCHQSLCTWNTSPLCIKMKTQRKCVSRRQHFWVPTVCWVLCQEISVIVRVWRVSLWPV